MRPLWRLSPHVAKLHHRLRQRPPRRRRWPLRHHLRWLFRRCLRKRRHRHQAGSQGTRSERSGGTSVGVRGRNGGMNGRKGGMNEGPSATRRHPPRRARHPRRNKPTKAGGGLATCTGELRSKFAGSCATTATPDRRREPRGGHHTGSPFELSGLAPLDLVLRTIKGAAPAAVAAYPAWRRR